MKNEQLKLEHLAPYLPYGLKLSIDGEDHTYTMVDYEEGIYNISIGKVINSWINGEEKKQYKPNLRPLSQLTKEIEHNGETFVPALKLAELSVERGIYKDIAPSIPFEYKIIQKPFGKVLKVSKLDDWVIMLSLDEPDRMKHFLYQKLIEWKFDVKKLIEKNLAIDVTTLETNPYK